MKTIDSEEVSECNDTKLFYIFCVTLEEPSLKSYSGCDEIFFIEAAGLYTAVKYVSEDDYSEVNIKKRLSDESWLDANVRAHLKVIGLIMQANTVIPFNFGTIYKSEESLKSFVTRYASDFKKNLLYLENKEEWSVKAFCNNTKIVENIVLLSQNIADIELQIKESSPGKAYILKKKKADILGKEINEIYNTLSKNLFNRINEFSDEYRLHAISQEKIAEDEDDMIINASFLLRKENLDNFIKTTDSLLVEHENIGLSLEIAGPWPPYSFVNLSN